MLDLPDFCTFLPSAVFYTLLLLLKTISVCLDLPNVYYFLPLSLLASELQFSFLTTSAKSWGSSSGSKLSSSFCLVGWLVGCFSIYKCPHFTLALKRQFHRGPRFPAASDVPSASNTIIPQSSGCHHLDTSLALVMILSLFTLAALKVFVSDVLQFYYKMSRYEFPFLFNLLESCWASWIWGLISFINSRKLLSHFSLW